MGLQNLCSITAPVVSGRRRMAASFPVSERRATGSAVINGAQSWGSNDFPVKSDMSVQAASNVSNVLLKSDMSTQTVSNLVNPPVFDTVTSQNVVSIQSTPLYVSSHHHHHVLMGWVKLADFIAHISRCP